MTFRSSRTFPATHTAGARAAAGEINLPQWLLTAAKPLKKYYERGHIVRALAERGNGIADESISNFKAFRAPPAPDRMRRGVKRIAGNLSEPADGETAVPRTLSSLACTARSIPPTSSKERAAIGRFESPSLRAALR